MRPKPIAFLGDSLKRLRGFPADVRRDAGYQLDRLQHGLKPNDVKPLPTVGAGAEEIRIWDTSGTYRVVYLARRFKTIYVLHAFKKKTQRTQRIDIEIAKRRYAQIEEA
jgi:phage-related protein